MNYLIDITKLSSQYTVREMTADDVTEILDLCRGNPLFYEYCQAESSETQILDDLRICPPGKDLSDKYYVGFYDDGRLLGVMDLIVGYPEDDIAFIGFFMMEAIVQGQGLGSKIIAETAAYLKTLGMTAIRLGIDKDNPQSNHFWKKNGFKVINEVERDDQIILYAERIL